MVARESCILRTAETATTSSRYQNTTSHPCTFLVMVFFEHIRSHLNLNYIIFHQPGFHLKNTQGFRILLTITICRVSLRSPQNLGSPGVLCELIGNVPTWEIVERRNNTTDCPDPTHEMAIWTGTAYGMGISTLDFEDSGVPNSSSIRIGKWHHHYRSPNITGILLLPMSASEQWNWSAIAKRCDEDDEWKTG